MLNDNIKNIEERNIVDQVTSAIRFRYTNSFFQNLPNLDKQILEFKRYLASSFFAVKAYYYAGTKINWNPIITFNNNASMQHVLNNWVIEERNWKESIKLENKLQFKDIQNVSLISNDGDEPRFLTSVIFNQNTNKKDFLVTKPIQFRTPKIIRFLSRENQINNDVQNKNLEIFYNNIILFPQDFKVGVHNKVVFKVAIYNDNVDNMPLKEDIERDFALKAKNISNLILNDSKETLELTFVRVNKSEYIGKYKIFGNIEILSNTYYDYIKKKTFKGVGPGSKQGYILPFNYKGILNPIIKLDINEDFKDITLGTIHKIQTPYIDPSGGLIKLSFKEVLNEEKNNFNFHLIKNDYFGKVIAENLILEELKLLNVVIKKREEDETTINKN